MQRINYTGLYIACRESLFNKYNENKVRIQHKHCRMAFAKANRQFPRMRKFDHGTTVYTYDTGNGIYFTSRPKQKYCRKYTVYKVSIIREQYVRNDLW